MRSWLRVAAITIAVIVFMSLLGFRLGHPQSGLSSAVGSAESSVVLYRQTEKLSAGDRVLVDIGDATLSPATSIIRNIDGEKIDVQAGELLVSVKRVDVEGKILALLPLLGSILGVFGL